jgi:Asp-tRNA(Asn)/Glu-tRNA(Gln) amidotransferase A subunit family amidase
MTTINIYNIGNDLKDMEEQKIDLHTFVNQLCDRIDQQDPKIQALLPEVNRRARLLKDVEELEERFQDPEKRPPLYGHPVGVKDVIRVDGFSTKAGSKLPEEIFEGPEASCVKLLQDAGALIVGKTHTTEFAFFESGPTANPHNLSHTPGGSSSGSAAGAAAGFFTSSLGTQTIGSMIRPAAFCGVIGFKPTFDRIQTEGLVYFSRSMDHIGIFSQDIEEMEKTAGVLCQGWNPEKTSHIPEAPVIGVPEGPYLKQMPVDGLVKFEENLKQLERAGYVIKYVSVFENIEWINQLHKNLVLFELAKEHMEWFKEYGSLYRNRTREGILKGQKVSEETVAEAKVASQELRQSIHRIMDENRIDLWVSPAALGTAPEGLHATGDPIMNLPWTYLGMPAINIPVGSNETKLPVGLQFVSKFEGDEQLLAWGKALIKHLNHDFYEIG